MKRILIIALLALIVPQANAQDIHFSQFYNTPLIVNPAFTGVFGGDQRAMLIYRNQWSSVATPYKTFGGSFDTRMFDKRNGNFSLIANVMNENVVLADPELGWVKLDIEEAQWDH